MVKISRFKEWDYVRGIGTLLVVIGHSFPDDTGGIYFRRDFFGFLKVFLYSFHMPLFVFMSGFFAFRLINLKDCYTKSKAIRDKFRRLMIPYLTIGVCYIPLQIIMSRFSTRTISVDTVLIDFLSGRNPNYQLWTLYVLFVLSAIAIMVANLQNIKIVIGLFGVISLISCYYQTGINIIDRVSINAPFFFLGILVRSKYEAIKEKKISICTACGLSGILVGFSIILFQYNMPFVKLITSCIGIMTVYCWANVFMRSKLGIIDVMLNTIAFYSMDIYILSNLAQTGARLVGMFLNIPYSLLFVAEMVAGIVVPIIVSKYIVRKIPILRKTMLGMW